MKRFSISGSSAIAPCASEYISSGLAPRAGLFAPLLQVFEHLLLESFPWNPKGVQAVEECLKNQPQEIRDLSNLS